MKRPAEVVFPVEVAPVVARRVEYRVTAVGAIDAFENVQVTARVAGVLERMHFKEGETVKQGALLAEIEPQRFQLAVTSAQASLASTQAGQAEAERELERAQKLAAEGLSTGAEVATWQTKLATAHAQESAARAALSLAQLNLRDARLRAPLGGSIQTRNVQTGQYVQPGTVIATLIRRDPLLLRFKVTEAEAGRLVLGMQADFRVSGNAETHHAKLTFVAGSAEVATRMVPVVAEIADDATLRPGAFTEVTVPIGANEAALAVPETAIRPTERGFVAFAVEGDVARERIVQLGLRTPDGAVEVLKGLALGDSLVVRGGEALKEGAKVRVGSAKPRERYRGHAELPPGDARGGDAMSLTEICVKRPVLAWMIMLATIVFGVVAAGRIGVSQMPDVDFPTISVSVTWEGAAPEVIENDVVQILEDALAQVEGAKSLTATSRQGSAQITVELDLARNVDLALQDVQTKIAQAQRTLPRDLDPPIVSKTNPEDQPILWVAVSGPFTRQLITDYARYQVRQKLQTVPGVGEVMMGGYVDRNVRVWLDATKLDQRGVAVADVMAALSHEHVELPAGRIESEGREIDVRVLGEALNLAEMRRLVVRNTGNAPVYLGDVALVEDGFADIRSAARASGQTAQGLGIKKQRGANTVAVAKAVRGALDDVRKAMPEGMRADVIFDSSAFVEASVADIEHELGLAVLLTAVVCWMFLGSFSSTLNVVLAIPMSLFGTLAVIYFLGFTLNTFSLLAMALAVGIVVDDAIMVMENIFRHREAGKSAEAAAIDGTHEIRFAALAATAAICAIFIPVVFMQGIIGKFFFQFGITLSLSVVFSYVEAITLAPARCAQFLKKHDHEAPRSWLGRGVDAAFEGLRRGYARTLGWGLRRPALVLLVTLVFLGGSVSAFRALPGEFVPSQDQSRIMVRLQSAVGSSLEEMDGLMKKAEDIVNARPDVLRSFAVVGGASGTQGVNTGMMFVTMLDKHERTTTQSELMGILRKQINQIPGLRGVVMDLSQQGFTARRGFPVEFSVRGSDWNQLVEAADDAKKRLAATGTVVDIDTDYLLGMPELRIVPDRARISDLGLSVEEVAQAVNVMVGGTRSGKFNADGRRIDVRVRLLAAQRSRPESLEHLKLRTPRGELVPLASLIRKEERPAAQSITRLDRERAISIYGNVAPTSSQDKALAAVEGIGKHMPAGTRLVLGGSSVAFRESMQSLTFALLLGIVVAFMVLAAQFNSLLHPVTVLTILPLSIAGAAFGLLIAHQSVNIFSMIGVLLLMGIAKKNSIILVDYANRLREGGLDALTAMREAGPVRLRPILMTSIATLMAAVPAALGLGEGSETRVPMAVAVIGGLLVSTALSLYVVPAFYVLAERSLGFLRRIVRGKGGSTPPLARRTGSA